MGAKINDNESDDFWGDDRVLFIRERIRSCHSKLSDVGKFKNLFQTQENRYVECCTRYHCMIIIYVFMVQ